MNKTEQQEFRTSLFRIVNRLQFLVEDDIRCDTSHDHVTIGVRLSRIVRSLPDDFSFGTWLKKVNVTVYSETCYKLNVSSFTRMVYFKLGIEDFLDTDDIVGDFTVVTETILKVIDRSLIGMF